jgi:hypothetical protein
MVSSRFHKLSMIVLINTSLRVLRIVASKNDILIFVHRRCGCYYCGKFLSQASDDLIVDLCVEFAIMDF